MRTSSSKLLAWWQLLRIGNVFTAVSNVIVGYLLADGGWESIGALAWAIGASVFLYETGMVLNDAFDVEVDKLERPERPIPSGRISRLSALLVGFLLQLAGLACGTMAMLNAENLNTGLVTLALAVFVVGYNLIMKWTPLGPLTMGLCRFLNVLLGASIAGSFVYLEAFLYAATLGIYTAGISYYARGESALVRMPTHLVGELLIVISLGSLLAMLITQLGFHTIFPSERIVPWLLCWVVVLTLTNRPLHLAKKQNEHFSFRRAVGTLLRGIILYDALAAYLAAGWMAGVLVLTLLIPTWIASRFAPMT